MVYNGHTEHGVIILDDVYSIPDGVSVRVEFSEEDTLSKQDLLTTFSERFAAFAGIVEGMPEDAAENHNHYLYDMPKR